MCGRATLSSPASDVAELFDVEPIDLGPPRFNIAPSQPILTVRAKRSPSTGEEDVPHDASSATSRRREMALVRWGLIPWWAKPDEAKKIASRCIQARAETAPRSSAFRDAFRRHRCLVVIDGFFEWKTLPDGRRMPHHIRRARHEPFAIAGLWDSWRPPSAEDGARSPERIESCAVLTTRSAGRIAAVHDRMPLVLPANDWDVWLSDSVENAAQLLAPTTDVLEQRANALVVVPVSTWVNDVRHDDPRCIEPATASSETPLGQIALSFATPSSSASARRRRT